MSTEAVTLFFALLAVVAQVTVLALVAVRLSAWSGPEGAARWDRWRSTLAPHALTLAAGVAITATLGSLYLSEVANFTPCRLCWYQRLAMYPLGPILAVAAWQRWYGVRRPAMILAAVGGAISVWHILIERYPSLESSSCDPSNPCSLVWVRRFGYLTIPTMALSGFALIVALLAVAPKDSSPKHAARMEA